MVPPPIQSRHRKPITYGRISHSSSANFKVFQDTVEGSNRSEEPRATANYTVEIVPRRIRPSGLLPSSLPPMAEQSFQRSEFDSIYHIGGDDIGGDPFADPLALNPQASTGLAHTKEVKESAWPSLSRKVALAEKSVNHPILRNTTVVVTSDTGRTSGPPPRPRKIRHHTPSLGDQDLPHLLSPSKARSPISEDNYFRRFSTRAGGKEVNRPYSTPPTGSGIDQHGMADGNSRASTWVRDKARYLMKKTAEKMGSSPPNARHKSHCEEVTPTPLEMTSREGVRKTISPQYSVERMKRRRKGYEPVPAAVDCGTGYESNGDSPVKDPFCSGQDGDFEHGIFAGESSDYIAEIPKRRRNFQEPYGWGTRAQNTQNLLAQAKGMNPPMKAGTRHRSRKFKYNAELEDKNLGEYWDERESLIAGATESLMAYMSDSNENVSPGPVKQPTSKRPSWGQLRTHSKNKSKKQSGKGLPLENEGNFRSKFPEPAGDTDTDPSVGSGAKRSAAYVAQKRPDGISTVHTSGGIKRHDVRSGKLVRNKKLGEDGLGSWDSLGSREPSPDSLPVRASPQNATYPDASQTGGVEGFRGGSNIPNAGIGKGTRTSASLDTRSAEGNRQSGNGKPVTRPEDSTFQGPIRTPRNISPNIVGNKSIGSHSHGAIPMRENPPKGIPYNPKRKKDVKKTKTAKPKVKMVFEDDDLDELQMDLPGMRI
ncbi:hypothetical protein HOY80DRAFT_912106 [Tuber brumale]|nr:hypothetical protein HOY80DRAFT_912106 [Tuber brumale]